MDQSSSQLCEAPFRDSNGLNVSESNQSIPSLKDSNVPSHLLELKESVLKQFSQDFYGDPKNILAQNACTRHDPIEVAVNRRKLEEVNHCFTHKVESEGKPVTNQKSSGRCWSFACLNAIRIPFMKAFNISEFEFSTAYMFFWDKLEKSNFFLHNIVKTAKEPLDGRTVSFLLSDPINDGGQWEMMTNLVTKYGLVPKKCFPESFSSECTARMNSILKSKLREYARALRGAVEDGVDDAGIRKLLDQQISTIYRILGICLGVPPSTFTWEYYQGKNNTYASIGPITPLEFYEKHVRPTFDMRDKVCLVTDPRKSSPYNRLFMVDFLGNMVGGRPCLYNNQPIEVLENVAAESIKQGEAVWLGCEVGKRFAGKQGVNDPTIHDFSLLFGTDVSLSLTREDRLLYHESAMSHAMIFTAVSLDNNGRPTKWRLQNSWGEDRGEKGYLVMSSEWFREYLFEIVVDRKFVPPEILAVYDQNPIVLPPWDPMGVLTLCDTLKS